MFSIGELDGVTMGMINTPRCGSDLPEKLQGSFHGSRWSIRNITYNITDYPLDLEIANVDEVIRLAFNEWAKISDFTFSKVRGDAHISIEFSYESQVSFGTIAGTGKYPVFGGDISLSKNVRWSTDIGTPSTEFALNLYQILVHEIGHSLGLLHSSYPDSIMTPFFTYGEIAHLHPSDKKKLRKLYNIDATSTKKSDLSNQNYSIASICTLTKMDAIIAYSENIVYVLNDDKYWMLSAWADNIIFDLSTYPRKISDTWKGVPASIDSAFVDEDNSTYFFKGSQCWKFLPGKDTPVAGFPKKIADEFPGIPNDIDAVMVLPESKIYFFKGGQYWRFMPNEIPEVHASYPKSITLWDDKLTTVDAALYFMDESYFFKDMLYYKYQETRLENLLRSRWSRNNLTYKIIRYSRKLKREVVDKEVKEAFDLWGRYLNKTFTQRTNGSVDAEIGFFLGRHNDGAPFDGPGEVLAHAFFPIFGGDIHFDESERWTSNENNGVNFKQVVTHEVGHSIGLRHSKHADAVMNPMYKSSGVTADLTNDDLKGIRWLYKPIL
ncbi:matrix metalloproteinase [Holotrichia oblita]|uniref:Matrix metalloproteinase n=1 Tax=Holotrichia oblita TaxID=644536 RepID=A0ACB9TC83_HOLOL|nr:matrix metalloproteinase [Holotrichia oblita]